MYLFVDYIFRKIHFLFAFVWLIGCYTPPSAPISDPKPITNDKEIKRDNLLAEIERLNNEASKLEAQLNSFKEKITQEKKNKSNDQSEHAQKIKLLGDQVEKLNRKIKELEVIQIEINNDSDIVLESLREKITQLSRQVEGLRQEIEGFLNKLRDNFSKLEEGIPEATESLNKMNVGFGVGG